MKQASFTATFDYLDKATVSYTYYALRQLPFCVLMDISITAKKDINHHRRKCDGSAGCPQGRSELL